MAKQLKGFQFRQHGGQRKYPWEQWFDGKIWQLTKGEDFDIAPYNMRLQILSRAREKRGYARTSVRGDVVVFQFFPADPS